MRYASRIVRIVRDLQLRRFQHDALGRKRIVALIPVLVLLLGLSACVLDPLHDKNRGRPLNDLERLAGRNNTLRLPDLRPRSAHKFVSGDEVTISVKIQNRGRADAGRFDFIADVHAPGLAGGTFTKRIMNLRAGDEVQEVAGTIIVPLARRPVDVIVAVTADPVTGNPRWGQVLEENEGNNHEVYSVTVF